jgi:hypothetical protein
MILASGLAGHPAFGRDGVRTIPMPSNGLPEQRSLQPSHVDPQHPARAVERGELSVVVDRAKVIRLPERTQTVVLGNPAIADISVQKNGIGILTGKSYGVTNLIALDAGGRLLAESILSVAAPTDSVVVVQRGLDRQTYSCTPVCQPSVVLGDSNSYFAEAKGQAEQHTQFATQR